MKQKVVLITGCSSGIGKALAKEYHQCGCKVIATARNIESIKDLEKQGMMTGTIDVLNSANMEEGVKRILNKIKHIDILINNAGYGLIGPLIETGEEEILRQFQTNVFGVLKLTQLVAPNMKEQSNGLIINIGSISGLLTSPFSGGYCASKASIHSFSDALRLELAPFGIKVMNVQTGAIETNFGNAAKETIGSVLKPDSWYSTIASKIHMRAEYSQINATPVNQYVKKVVKASFSINPPAIFRIGKMSTLFPLLKLLLPVRILDRIFKKKFGLLDELK